MADRIVVVGSNSFSGAHFVDRILNEGSDVLGMSRSAEPDAVFLPYRENASGRLSFHQLDLNHDLARMMELIDQFRPDYVVNFAAQ